MRPPSTVLTVGNHLQTANRLILIGEVPWGVLLVARMLIKITRQADGYHVKNKAMMRTVPRIWEGVNGVLSMTSAGVPLSSFR